MACVGWVGCVDETYSNREVTRQLLKHFFAYRTIFDDRFGPSAIILSRFGGSDVVWGVLVVFWGSENTARLL